MSLKLILPSDFWYLPSCLSRASMAETKADFMAFSGLPPCSSQEELW